MKFFYSDHITIPLPDGHRFPMPKYRLLHQRVLETNLVPAENLREAPPAADEDILRVHLPERERHVELATIRPTLPLRWVVAGVAVIGVNIGDLALDDPFDPDHSPYEPHNYVLTIAVAPP